MRARRCRARPASAVTTIEGLVGHSSPPAAAGLDRRGRAAVRLLPVGADHGGGGAAAREPAPDRRRHRRRHGGQHLPLRHLPARSARRSTARPRSRRARNERHRQSQPARLPQGGRLRRRRAPPRRDLRAVRGRRRAQEPAAASTFAPNAFVRIASDDERHGDRQPLGDGAGRLHLAPDARRRGARRRLDEGPLRARARRPGLQPHGLRHPDDRRQHEHVERVGPAAQGGAAARADARRRRGRHVEGRPGVVPHGERARSSTRIRGGASPTARSPRRRRTSRRPRRWCSRTRRTSVSSGSRRSGSTRRTRSNGKAVFGIDVTLPGMLVAVVARPPVFGGKVKGFDAAKAMAVPGVKHVVQIERGVGVVADGFWPAKRGREALRDHVGRRPARHARQQDAGRGVRGARGEAGRRGAERRATRTARCRAPRRRSRPSTRCPTSRTRRWSR